MQLLSVSPHDAMVIKRLRRSHNTADYEENSIVQKWWQSGPLAFSVLVSLL